MKKLKKLSTAILLIAFNRPDLTAKILRGIAQVKPKKLYIAIDGSRNKLEEDKVSEVKKLVSVINWPCEVKTNYQKNNLGCKYGPIAAMNWFFENEKMGIILEDDILVTKSFFYYCERLLNKYKDDLSVGTISGDNFTPIESGDSYMFSRYSQTWGWATWKRVWDKYDDEIKDWPTRRNSGWLESIFDDSKTVFYWKLIFDQVYEKVITSAWDYQWTYMSWKNNFLTIVPKVNLATNIGIGVENASHTKIKGRLFDYPKHEIKFPLVHPKVVDIKIELDNFIQKNNYILWKEVGMFLFRKLSLVNKKVLGR